MTKKTQEFPFPLLLVLRNPKVVALPVAGLGMLFRILGYLWETELRPLPKAEGELFTIARAHRPTWAHHKLEILAILSEVVPELQAHIETWQRKKAALKAFTAKVRRGGRNASVDSLSNIETTPKRTEANRAAQVKQRVSASSDFAE